jgi:hypothetical protein
MEHHIKIGFQKAIGWMGCAFWGFMVAACVIAKIHWLAYVIFGGFFLLSLWLLLSSGEIVISSSHIKYITVASTHVMQWDEVTSVEVDPYSTSIIFHGSGKRLVIPGPSNWSRTNDSLISFLEQEALLRNIQIDQDNLAAFKSSKHTKLKRRGSGLST